MRALAFLAIALLSVFPVYSDELKPGDPGYMHTDTLHGAYQKVFPQVNCHCSTGQCRPTIWRWSQENGVNPFLQVMVQGSWCKVPDEALRKHYEIPSDVSVILRQYGEAHVCAYTRDTTRIEMPCPKIECVLMLSDS